MNRKNFGNLCSGTEAWGARSFDRQSAPAIALFPGSMLCLFLLDFLGVNFGTWRIPATAFPINLICWYEVSLAIRKIRGEKST